MQARSGVRLGSLCRHGPDFAHGSQVCNNVGGLVKLDVWTVFVFELLEAVDRLEVQRLAMRCYPWVPGPGPSRNTIRKPGQYIRC